MEWHKLELGENDDNRRVDTILRSINAGEGLSGMFAAIRKGLIRLNGRKTAANARVSAGDILEIAAFLLPSGTAGMTGPDKNAPDGRRNAAGAATDAAGTLSAESPADSGTSPDSCTLPVPVLFESDHIIAVCKPVGMLVHDGDNSLDAHLQKYLRGRIKPSVSFRPGPLHRLDRNTSGVICFSKSLDGARWFSEQMQQGTIRKYYLAIVQGELPPGYQETWRDHLQRSSLVTSTSGTSGGTHAETRARRLGTAVRYKNDQPKDTHTLLGLRLITGRTHQIRVQSAERGHPVLGDTKYGTPSPELSLGRGLLLHSAGLLLPAWEHDTERCITASLPRRWYRLLQMIHDPAVQSVVPAAGSNGSASVISPAPHETEAGQLWLAGIFADLFST